MWESENQDESPLMTTDNFHGIDRLVAVSRLKASSSSPVSRATSVSWPAGTEPRRGTALGALRPLGFTALWRRALAGLLPALERLFIAATRA
jgi:hypothetical protein